MYETSTCVQVRVFCPSSLFFIVVESRDSKEFLDYHCYSQMYSETTELNEDVTSWSSKQTIINDDNRYDDNRDDDNRDAFPQKQIICEFGDFVDNYGWIQSRSKSYPDRVYFYNIHSGCNTWYRPISCHIDVPFISIEKAYADEVLENNIELLSDDENEPSVSAVEHDKSLTAVPDDSCRSLIDANEYRYEEKQIVENNNDDDEDEKSDSEMICATNFLETKFFVREDEVNHIDRIFNSSDNDVSSATTQSSFDEQRFVNDVSRLKKIKFEDQLIKTMRIRDSNNRVHQGSKKIICDMYGVRTVNYDLPTPDQVRAEVGVKSSRLSESDSDVSEPSSHQEHAKHTTLSFEWSDIEKNLHQPLLSDPSSSPSSRSDTNSSDTSCTSSIACSCSTCSS